MLVTEFHTSIARDCLQAERSLLQFCKFAATLSLVSFAVLLDYRLDFTQIAHLKKPKKSQKYVLAFAILFFMLSVGSLALGSYNYYNSISHYVQQRKRTGPRRPTNFYLSIAVCVLLAVNIALLIDGYSVNS